MTDFFLSGKKEPTPVRLQKIFFLLSFLRNFGVLDQNLTTQMNTDPIRIGNAADVRVNN
jgi:hypothetical protein